MEKQDLILAFKIAIPLVILLVYSILSLVMPKDNRFYPIVEAESYTYSVAAPKTESANKKVKRRRFKLLWLYPYNRIANFSVTIYKIGANKNSLPQGGEARWQFGDSEEVLYSLAQPTNHIRKWAYYFIIVRGVETSGFRDHHQQEEGPENATVDFVFGGWVECINDEIAYKKGEYLEYLYNQTQSFLYEKIKLFSYADLFKIQLEKTKVPKQKKEKENEKQDSEIHVDWKDELNNILELEIGHRFQDLNLHDYTLAGKSKEFEEMLEKKRNRKVEVEISVMDKTIIENKLKPYENTYAATSIVWRQNQETPSGDAVKMAEAIKEAKPKILNVTLGGNDRGHTQNPSFDSAMQLFQNLASYKVVEDDLKIEDGDGEESKKKKNFRGKK